MRDRFAFTLIELLVVMGIIVVLIGILVPALRMARVSTHRVTSASHMRQIGLALHLYQDDYKGWFPLTSHGNPDKSTAWIYVLAPYLTDARQSPDPDDPGESIWQIGRVRLCPRDPKAAERMEAGGTSYIMNEWVVVPLVDPFGQVDWSQSFNRRDRLARPSGTMTMFVGADDMGVGTSNDHAHSRDWATWADVIHDIEPDRYGTSSDPSDLNGSSNYLYADGHVESHDARDRKSLIDAGTNFSRPPG